MKNINIFGTTASLIYAIIVLTGIFYIIYHNQEERKEKSNQFLNIQRQAISNNFAHWEVNIDGKTTFKWNTNANVEKN
jgi:hypothetical protein